MGFNTDLADALKDSKSLRAEWYRLQHNDLRTAYDKLLVQAESLIQQIKQVHQDTPGTAANALSSVRRAQGKLAYALRLDVNHAPSGLWTYTPAPGAEQLKDAVLQLQAALSELSRVGSSSSQGRPSVQQVQGLGAELEPVTGLFTRFTGNVFTAGSIAALSLKPGAEGSFRPDLCVVVNYPSSRQLNLYAGCSKQQLRSITLTDKSNVTCIACNPAPDGSARIWTGHEDGLVTVFDIPSAACAAKDIAAAAQNRQEQRVGFAVCSLALQQGSNRCWVGDKGGWVSVMELAGGSVLLHKGAVKPKPQQQPQPVQALLNLGPFFMLATAGATQGKAFGLQLLDCARIVRAAEFPVSCGAVTSLQLVDELPGWLQLSPQSSALQSSASWRSSGGDDAASSASSGDGLSRFRVASGHAGGQVMLWEVGYRSGRSSGPHLRELAVIGRHHETSVVKGIFPYPQWDMLVVATSLNPNMRISLTGKDLGLLSVMRMPTEQQLTSELKRHQFLAAPSSTVLPTVDLPTYVHGGHMQNIEAAVCLGNTIVTASATTVNVWSPRQLASLAADRGMLFGRAARVSSSSYDAGRPPSDPALLAAAAGHQHVSPSSGSGSDPSPFFSSQLSPPQQPLQPQHQPSPPLPESQQPQQLSHLPSSHQQQTVAGPQPADAGAARTSGGAVGAGAHTTVPITFNEQQQPVPQDPAKKAVAELPGAVAAFGSGEAIDKVQQYQQQEDQQAEQRQAAAADLPANLEAELSAHCGYTLVRQLPDSMFKGSRVLQVRCNTSNRLRTLLQIPCATLQEMQRRDYRLHLFAEQLVAASSLHHPHTLQVHEVFQGPLHLHIVLEECSAGLLLDYPRKQATNWGAAVGAEGGAAAVLSPDFARWFFQQVVLAVDYYHHTLGNSTSGGAAPHPSRLAIKETVLKVAPNLPQPVVKVPTTVLACGVEPLWVSATAADNAFVPPEARRPQSQGGQRHDTPAGDVWACGVLLLTLLGGQLNEEFYSANSGASSSSSSSPAQQAGPFQLKLAASSGPTLASSTAGQQASGDTGADGLRALLADMLHPDPQQRITLQRLQQHPWFKFGLPPAAASMTARYLEKGRACKQSPESIQAAVLAAAVGQRGALRLVQQLQARQHKRQQGRIQQQQQRVTPSDATGYGEMMDSAGSYTQQQSHAQQQQQQQRGRAVSGDLMDSAGSFTPHQTKAGPTSKAPEMVGPVPPQLQRGLQLQVQSLRQACVKLVAMQGGNSASNSASKLTEQLVQQQAAVYGVNAFQCTAAAVRALQMVPRLQQAKLGLRSTQSKQLHGLALLLHTTCSHALYAVCKLQQLLRGVQEPWTWNQLQANVPAAFPDEKPQRGTVDLKVQLARPQHLIQLQLHLLLTAHHTLYSLWVCSKASAAVITACMGRVLAARHAAAPKPHILTAVHGPTAGCVAGVGCILMHLLLQSRGSQTPQGSEYCRALEALMVYVLVLVHWNDHSSGQQGVARLPRPVQVPLVEGMTDLMVEKQPLQDQYSGSSCVAFRGRQVAPKLQGQQQQHLQAGEEVVVVGLVQLVPVSNAASKALLPPNRMQAHEQRLEEVVQAKVWAEAHSQGNVCGICLEILQRPTITGDGYTFCRHCLVDYLNTNKGTTELRYPLSGKPWPRTNRSVDALIDNLFAKGKIQRFLEEMEAQKPLLKAQEEEGGLLQRLQAQADAAGGEYFPAREHLGLAHAAGPSSAAALQALKDTLLRLWEAGLLGAANARDGASSSSSSDGGSVPFLAPIRSLCLDPPLLVLPKPPAGNLQAWISDTAGRVHSSLAAAASDGSSSSRGDNLDFTAAWVAATPWPEVLQALGDVAAALCSLHQQHPAVVHGGVNAAAVDLLLQLPDNSCSNSTTTSGSQQEEEASPPRRAQLSLVGLLARLSPISSCHPFLSAPETLVGSGAPTPAVDVYGFGLLLFQLATGWLPQQYTPGTDDQISAVLWCREMMAQAGSTSPLAAAQALAGQQQQQQKGAFQLSTGAWTPYGQHMLSAAALAALPPGYASLMQACLRRMAPARPCMQEVATQLQAIAKGAVTPAQAKAQWPAFVACTPRAVAAADHAAPPDRDPLAAI